MRGDDGSERPRVLFAYPFEATFIRSDLDLLRTFCDVVPFRFTGLSAYPSLLRAVRDADIVVSWFALGFSAAANIAAKALGRRSIVVAGGWDVVGFPEIAYGRLLSRLGSFQAKASLSTADQVLAFSSWSEEMIRGIAPNANVRTAHLGVDVGRFSPGVKENLVVCVAHVSRENLARKGLRTFALASRTVPEAQFALVGRHWDDAVDELRRLTDNVTFPGWLSDDELRDLLGRAKVYVQPSYTEGFGLALAEAMASGCVPVVTRAGAIPEVVGDSGFYAEYGSDRSLSESIRRALTSDLGPAARNRVRERFSLDRRLMALRRAIKDVSVSDRRVRQAAVENPIPPLVEGNDES